MKLGPGECASARSNGQPDIIRPSVSHGSDAAGRPSVASRLEGISSSTRPRRWRKARKLKAKKSMVTPHNIATLLRGSLPGGFPENILSELLEDCRVIDFPADSVLYREEEGPGLALVLEGSARTFISSPMGRQITIRYAHSGDFLGIPTLFVGSGPVHIAAISPIKLCVFQASAMRAAAMRDPRVAWALAQECAFTLVDLIAEMSDAMFGSVRQRISHHLLNLVCERENGLPVIHASAQDLAFAVGSVREVVSRALAELRADGMITTRREAILLKDERRLRELAAGQPSRIRHHTLA